MLPSSRPEETGSRATSLKRINFFATTEDLAPLLAAVERTLPVKYVLKGRFHNPGTRTYASSLEIPDLGCAHFESAVLNDTYLVVLKERPVEVRSVRENDGVVRYRVDALLNPAAVLFTPGGRWSEEVLLHGVLLSSDHGESKAVMKPFAAHIRKTFHKIKAFWVGPHAEALLDAGKRLTNAEQSPREFDLTRAQVK